MKVSGDFGTDQEARAETLPTLERRAVNYDGAQHTLLTRLQGSRAPANATVKLITLTAGLDETNSLSEPDRLRRVETTKPYARDMAFELPPHTVAVIEIRAN